RPRAGRSRQHRPDARPHRRHRLKPLPSKLNVGKTRTRRSGFLLLMSTLRPGGPLVTAFGARYGSGMSLDRAMPTTDLPTSPLGEVKREVMGHRAWGNAEC